MSGLSYESLAHRLAERGEILNNNIASDQETLLRNLRNGEYLAVVIANAFTWTGHAVNKPGFFDAAINYLMTGNPDFLGKAGKFFGRWGEEALCNGLHGWKTIADQPALGDQDFRTCNAKELRRSQERYFDIASNLFNQGQLSGVGPWLFCAPFKIVAAHRTALWQAKELDELRMPLGLEVVRGMRKLIQRYPTYAVGLDANMLSEEEGGLLEGMGTVELVHDVCSKLVSSIRKSRVVHVNSGLYLYGKGEI